MSTDFRKYINYEISRKCWLWEFCSYRTDGQTSCNCSRFS